MDSLPTQHVQILGSLAITALKGPYLTDYWTCAELAGNYHTGNVWSDIGRVLYGHTGKASSGCFFDQISWDYPRLSKNPCQKNNSIEQYEKWVCWLVYRILRQITNQISEAENPCAPIDTLTIQIHPLFAIL